MLCGMSDDEKQSAPTSADEALSSARFSFAGVFARAKKLALGIYDEVWKPAGTAGHSAPMRIFSLLWRIVEITLTNRIPLQAAALTYYVLMALAPFVMFVLTIFGIVMNVRGEEAVETMKLRIAETMQIVAPETTEAELHAAEAASAPDAPRPSGGGCRDGSCDGNPCSRRTPRPRHRQTQQSDSSFRYPRHSVIRFFSRRHASFASFSARPT